MKGIDVTREDVRADNHARELRAVEEKLRNPQVPADKRIRLQERRNTLRQILKIQG